MDVMSLRVWCPGSSSRSCLVARFAPWRTRTAPWIVWGTRPVRRPACPAKQPPRQSPSPPATVNVTSDGQIGRDEVKRGYERQSNKQVIVPALSSKTHELIFDGCQNMWGSVICGGPPVLIVFFVCLFYLFAFCPRVDN